jgi:hypothetical protein
MQMFIYLVDFYFDICLKAFNSWTIPKKIVFQLNIFNFSAFSGVAACWLVATSGAASVAVAASAAANASQVRFDSLNH